MVFSDDKEEQKLVDRPDLLDSWLESPEGMNFIKKYRLWHLKKEKQKIQEYLGKKKESPPPKV